MSGVFTFTRGVVGLLINTSKSITRWHLTRFVVDEREKTKE